MPSWEPVSALSTFAQPMGMKVLFALLLSLTQAFIIVVSIVIVVRILGVRVFERTYADNFSQELYLEPSDLEEAETNEGFQEFLDEASIVVVHNRTLHGVQTLS